MVDGEIGQSGNGAQLIAVVVTKGEQDRAITHLHNLKVTIVQLQLMANWPLKVKDAMKTLVLVCQV